ncbi:MAG: TonB-dependent receptor, partial [Planctomycetes bacterium]|nr:TonB-dependent receptor [Planctomycetota bacterium]
MVAASWHDLAQAGEPASSEAAEPWVLAAGDESGDKPAKPPVAVLPDVLITATGTGREPGDLPYTTDTIGEEAIRERKVPRTLPQALSETPGVSVQQTGHGLESPYIRGFTGFRTLLLIDGIRFNNATFREGPNQYWGLVDPLALQRIEVVKGPSSVLYGSDAIGGTVNAISVEDIPDGIHPAGYYRFASAEESHTVRGETRGFHGDRLSYSGGITWRTFGDLQGGRHTGLQENTGYDSFSGDAKVRWDVNGALHLTAAFMSVDQFDVPRTHSTMYGVSFHGTQVGSDLRRDIDNAHRLGYVRSEWLPEETWLERVSLTLSYQVLTEEENRGRSSSRTAIQGFDDHTLGASLFAVSPSPIGTWTYGAEYYGDFVTDSKRRDYNADGSLASVSRRGPVADDARYDTIGVFIQDEIQPCEPFTIIAGGRYTFVRAWADDADIDTDLTDAQAFSNLSESWQTVTGSLRGLYKLTDCLTPFAGVSQGFRAPNLSDLTRFDIARSGEQEIPAPGLDPEYFTSLEAGLHARWPGWGGTISYFYTDIDDMIVRYPTGAVTATGDPIVTRDNVGDGYLHGVELGLDAGVYEGLSAFGTFAWMEGMNETYATLTRKSKEPISRILPTQWLLGLRWESEDRTFWAESTARFVLREDRLSPDDELDTQRIPPDGTPGYTLIGLRGGVRIRE